MLTKLVIKDFKSFRNETIEFARSGLTVLVGPNASGKSSVLDAAQYAAEDLSAASSHNPPPVQFIRAGAERFILESTSTEGGTSKTVVHTCSGTQVGINPLPTETAGFAGAPMRFDVDLRRLRSPIHPRPTMPLSPFNEEQVVIRLLEMRLEEDASVFASLVTSVRKIVPAVVDLKLKRMTRDNFESYELRFDMTTGRNLAATQVSEGTLLAVALVAAVHAQKKPVLALIDDIDQALHPEAQRGVVAVLREAVKTQHLQVICTTHSPYLVRDFQYDEVRVLREIDGESRCKSLAEGPDAAKWIDELDAGEYWSFIESRMFERSVP